MRDDAPLRRLLREPFAQFALGAALLVGLDRATTRRPPPAAPTAPRLTADVRALEQAFHARTGRAPDAAESRALVDEHLRAEALAAEARARGLDRDDPVVRQRLAQKMELVLDAELPAPAPDDAALARWLADHATEFTRPATVAFEHALFASTRSDPDGDARRALEEVGPEGSVAQMIARSDPSPRGHAAPAMTFADLTRAFGWDFARAVESLPTGRWQGPVASPAGRHLVRVTAHHPGGLAPLADVRDEVLRRWTADRREALRREAVARVVRRWTGTP